MQVVPRLFKIIVVVCTVFLWGLISDFTFLIIFIYIFIQTTSLISACCNSLCGSFAFWKMWWQKATTAQDFSRLALPAGFVPGLEGLPLIARDLCGLIWFPGLLNFTLFTEVVDNVGKQCLFFFFSWWFWELHVSTRNRTLKCNRVSKKPTLCLFLCVGLTSESLVVSKMLNICPFFLAYFLLLL